MRLFNLPIEPLRMRYSAQWATWFRQAFTIGGYDVHDVHGDGVPDVIRHGGAFLDPYGTHRWKFSQLARLVRLLESTHGEPAIVFLHDAWFPGIEALGYIRALSGAPIKVVGYLHAGVYDPTDLLGDPRTGMGWAAGSEASWLAMLDAVFVGTSYHRRKVIERGRMALSWTSRQTAARVHVVGNPVGVGPDVVAGGATPAPVRERIVVFPHRLTSDKAPGLFQRLQDELEPLYPDVRWVRTHDLDLDKPAYLDLLSRAKVAVSFATHENFGIAMVEAAMLGCVPVAPNALAYPEVLPRRWLFDSFDQACVRVAEALDVPPTPYRAPQCDRYHPHVVGQRVVDVIDTLTV